MRLKEVTIVFNYRSPFCALIVEDIFQLAQRYSVDVKWRISREVPRPSSLPVTKENPRFAYNRQDCARRAAWQGLAWHPPEWRLTDVDAASVIGHWLLTQNSPCFQEFTIRCSQAYWCHGLNTSDRLVVERIALEAGLDPADLRQIWSEEHRLRAELDANANWCSGNGVLGVPYFIVDDQRFWGSDRFGALEHYLADQHAGPAPCGLDDGLLFADRCVPTIPIQGKTAKAAVNRVFCVEWEAPASPRRAEAAPDPEPLLFFMKPSSAVALDGAAVPYPSRACGLQGELKLVAVLRDPLFNATEAEAARAIFGYAAGLDMARPVLQLRAMEKGGPWEAARVFDSSAIVGPIHPYDDSISAKGEEILLTIDGETACSGSAEDVLSSMPRILSELSRHLQLQPGDLVYAGRTGASRPLRPGMTLHGKIGRLGSVECSIGEEQGAEPPATPQAHSISQRLQASGH